MYLEFTLACIILSNVALDHIMLWCSAAEVQADSTFFAAFSTTVLVHSNGHGTSGQVISLFLLCVYKTYTRSRVEGKGLENANAKHSKDSKTLLSR